MALNEKGIETLRIMLRVIAGDIRNIDEIGDQYKYLFKENAQDLKQVAIDHVARVIASLHGHAAGRDV